MKPIHFIFLLIIAAALAACSAPDASGKVTITPCPTSVASSAGACPLPTRTAPALPAGAVFQVLLADGKAAAFSTEQLKALPAASVTVDGKTEPGVRLLDVLSAAGVKDFSELTFNGETVVTLKKAQIDSEAALVAGGSARLVGAGLSAEQQVKGITTIRVK